MVVGWIITQFTEVQNNKTQRISSVWAVFPSQSSDHSMETLRGEETPSVFLFNLRRGNQRFPEKTCVHTHPVPLCLSSHLSQNRQVMRSAPPSSSSSRHCHCSSSSSSSPSDSSGISSTTPSSSDKTQLTAKLDKAGSPASPDTLALA